MGNICRRTDISSAQIAANTDITPGRVMLQQASAGQARPLPILPLSLAIVAREFSDRDSGSSGALTARMTAARRQMVLEMHRRQCKVRELQEALAAERLLVDDLVVALAIG